MTICPSIIMLLYILLWYMHVLVNTMYRTHQWCNRCQSVEGPQFCLTDHSLSYYSPGWRDTLSAVGMPTG